MKIYLNVLNVIKSFKLFDFLLSLFKLKVDDEYLVMLFTLVISKDHKTLIH